MYGADPNQPTEPLEQEFNELFNDQSPITGPASFLIVAPHDADLERCLDQLVRCRHTCTWAHTLREAHRLLEHEGFDLAIVASDLPDGCGTDLMPALRRVSPDTGTILLTERCNL